MFSGRFAFSLVVALLLASTARAQTQLITFETAEARGAVWEIVSTLPGCTIGSPRGSGSTVSALVDFDCMSYTRPPPGTRPGPGNVVRLFTRIALEQPWVVQSAAASYTAANGAAASVLMMRPAVGTAGKTRNPWVEFQMHPSGPTRGTVLVSLFVSTITQALPPAFNSCVRPAEERVFWCSRSADCASGYRCAPECANTCMRN
jgi:hypothetical protein